VVSPPLYGGWAGPGPETGRGESEVGLVPSLVVIYDLEVGYVGRVGTRHLRRFCMVSSPRHTQVCRVERRFGGGGVSLSVLPPNQVERMLGTFRKSSVSFGGLSGQSA
jgi:hypothetical protein